MKQTTKINNRSDISGPDYDPSKDPEVQPDTITECLVEWKNNLPYNKKRYIMIVGFTILIFLVVFLGYAYGGMKVCSNLDGLLDSEFKCHPNYYTNLTQTNIDMVGQSFTLPNYTIENGS